MKWKVYEKDNDYYIEGIKGSSGNDRMLFFQSMNSEWPEPESPNDKKKMHAALYDFYQCNDELKADDTFETPFGNFKCVSVHVVPDNGDES